MPSLSPIGASRPTPALTADIPLPHRPGCGNAPRDTSTANVVAQRLRLALDTAEALHLGPTDPIDLHVCELRQLARWHIAADGQDVRQYFQRWTIDDADPVFPVPVTELRRMIAQLEALPPLPPGPRGPVPPSATRTFG